jgi:hypothetical protein
VDSNRQDYLQFLKSLKIKLARRFSILLLLTLVLIFDIYKRQQLEDKSTDAIVNQEESSFKFKAKVEKRETNKNHRASF